MKLHVHRGARVDARANTHKHTKTHSTLFLDTQLKNVAVALEIVRFAKQLLRRVAPPQGSEVMRGTYIIILAAVCPQGAGGHTYIHTLREQIPEQPC